MDRWIGKTAVVTGASAGIGSAICVELANAGLQVVGLARRPHLIDALNSQVTGKGTIKSQKCDVADPAQITAAFKWVEDKFGGTDLLVNNAGIFKQGHLTEAADNPLSDEDLLSVLDVNLKGLILCTRHAIASMKNRQFDGHVININSIAGHYITVTPLFNVYVTSKHGVTAFTESVINELANAKSKIKITSVSPGLVSTDMTVNSLDQIDFTALQPKDIADSVLFVVATPPNVNITELTVRPVAEKKL